MSRLRNIDFTDREILLAINDSTGPDGYATSQDIAEQMGVTRDGSARTPAGIVSARLSWMVRNGMVAKLDPKQFGLPSKERLWIITMFGEAVMRGRLPAAARHVIEAQDPGALVMMMRELSRTAYLGGSFEVRAAVRREYLHTEYRRPR